MASFRVVVTDQVFPDTEVERQILSAIDAEVVVAAAAAGDLPELAYDADALLNTYLPLGRDSISRLDKCKVIARYGIGVDNVDLEAARDAGIVVTNVPDYSVEEVAVHAVTLILALMRRVPAAMAYAQRGQWGIDLLRPIQRLSEATVGIVGLGKIGSRVIAMLEPTACRIIGYDPYVTERAGLELERDLPRLLAQADIVSLHLPATKETRGMFDRATLDQMKPSALLVNTSRGALVSTPDLVAALKDGKIAGAALDVLEREAADAEAFSGVENVILTPHMAYYSESSLRESQRKAATQILKVLSGQAPDYPVT